ncbi:MAG: hypothetical protein ABH825_03010 [Candidatus Omnitrophota bacterium]
MWVWDVSIISSAGLTDDLARFCGKKNINRLYLSAYNFNKDNNKHYRAFNRRMHRNNIYVHALAGDPRWGLERYHQQPLRWIEDVLSFNRASKSAERFDGMHSDTEVYLLGRPWQANKNQVLKEYLDLNRKIMDLKEIEEANITFGVDMPFWYDDDPSMQTEWNGRTMAPSYHILDTVDSVNVMDYRNSAEGPNGSIALAANEIEYADTAGKKVYIGQETKENVYPVYITFGGMSESGMEKEIDKIVRAYSGHPSFAGIAIHHYRSYKKMTGEQ